MFSPGFQDILEVENSLAIAVYAENRGLGQSDVSRTPLFSRTFLPNSLSADLISQIVKDLDGEVSIWRTWALDAVWPIVYFDGIVVQVRGDDGRVSQHTLYVALGVNLQGRKELLGLWRAPSGGAEFWVSCRTDRKNRGLSSWPASTG